MKKLLIAGAVTLLLSVSANSFAWWGNNGWGNNGWGNSGWNDWPVWTPMYWAEEMFDDNDGYGPYNYGGYSPYGYGPNSYGGYSPYNYGGHGYGPYNGGFPGNGYRNFLGGRGW